MKPSITLLAVPFLAASAITATPAISQGRIILAGEAWPLSNTGFANAPDTTQFVCNFAKWFTGRGSGNFLIYSKHFTMTGSLLPAALVNCGHTVDVSTSVTFDLPTLLQYDAVLMASGPAVDMNVLISYVNAGGGVYVGSGTSSDGGAAGYWNPFLQAFGLELETSIYYSCNGVVSIDSPHPLFDGVNGLYIDGAQDMIDANPADSAGRLVVHCGPHALFAVYGDQVGVDSCGPAVSNSSGLSAKIHAAGALLASKNDLTISAAELPTNQFGYFLTSATHGSGVIPPGSNGVLCLGGKIGRFAKLVQSSGAAGFMAISVDLDALPMSPAHKVLPGETWLFQGWFRDVDPNATSNFTDVVSVTFQ